ncbi:hypothetical protein [Candidatus Binatus sp.]|jgi:hypothetical protein|uniref:hypothetical protein n=1 Tax=Candidatus Binatus sp. TaxID=2811406 RepID=UPI003BBD4A2C
MSTKNSIRKSKKIEREINLNSTARDIVQAVVDEINELRRNRHQYEFLLDGSMVKTGHKRGVATVSLNVRGPTGWHSVKLDYAHAGMYVDVSFKDTTPVRISAYVTKDNTVLAAADISPQKPLPEVFRKQVVHALTS